MAADDGSEGEGEGEGELTPRKDSGRAKLIDAARKAGIPLPCGIPSWAQLVARLWAKAFPKEPMPNAEGLPQFLPLALDLISRKLRRQGDEAFREKLRATLYEGLQLLDRNAISTGDQSLAVIARLLVQEQAAGARRRLSRVITLNVDDLVE